MARLKHAKTVYTLPEALYYPGAPVCITGGRLLAEGELLACLLTLQVIEDVRVKSVTAAFLPLDADGTPTGPELPYRYRVVAGRDACIGGKEPVLLPISEAAAFRARVLRVDFTEGEPWLCAKAWPPLPAQPTLEEAYSDPELAEQFRIRYGRDCRFAPTRAADLWLCTCGAVNRAKEAGCHRCHRVRSALEKVSVPSLRDESESRSKQEPLRLKAARSAGRALRRRLLLGAAVVLPILILVLGLLIAVPRQLERRSVYKGAQWLAGLGEFDEARAAYASLGDYRDSREMAGEGVDYLRAGELARRAAQDDASALQMIGHTRADLDEDTTAAILLYEAAQKEFEALGDYRDSREQAARCAEALAACRAALTRAAYDRAAALLESGQLSAAREAYLALGAEEEAREPVYRKAQALTAFIRTYNIRGIYASLSMDPGGRSLFSMSKDTALTLGSRSVEDLLASCGEDPVDLQLEDEPGAGLLPLDEAVIALIGTVEGYKDSAGLLAAIADATDYTREFFTLCENGDVAGAYDWLQHYEGAFEDRERWLSDLALYLPWCGTWDLYLGDATVIPLTLGRDGKCMSFRTRILLKDGQATLRLTDAGGEFGVDLYAEQGAIRFFNEDQEGVFYLVVITNAGHMSYLKYRTSGKLISSCEYEPVE
ncbi:MAG: hypothetical protein IIU18_04480 [Oscillospiraceae bacterium]|nr:hypothetical protein [Oscillospiraceae bacterium]